MIIMHWRACAIPVLWQLVTNLLRWVDNNQIAFYKIALFKKAVDSFLRATSNLSCHEVARFDYLVGEYSSGTMTLDDMS